MILKRNNLWRQILWRQILKKLSQLGLMSQFFSWTQHLSQSLELGPQISIRLFSKITYLREWTQNKFYLKERSLRFPSLTRRFLFRSNFQPWLQLPKVRSQECWSASLGWWFLTLWSKTLSRRGKRTWNIKSWFLVALLQLTGQATILLTYYFKLSQLLPVSFS